MKLNNTTWAAGSPKSGKQQEKRSSENSLTKKSEKEKKECSKNDFEFEKLLGKGGYGLVYLAKHIPTGKHCALKQIDKTLISQMGKKEHAKIERQILTTAKSPFLLKAVFTFQDDQLAWLGLEYCPGGDLKDFLAAIGCFEEKEAVFYFAEMIVGVSDLHAMGYLHRDLKPDNFLIDKNGHIKLADFGLAKKKFAVGKQKSEESELEPPKEKRRLNSEYLLKRENEVWHQKVRNTPIYATLSHSIVNKPIARRTNKLSKGFAIDRAELRKEYGSSIVGTPGYMSPEVTSGRHHGGSYYGEEVDWWSLGCVFFEMIFGSPPFTGDSVEELFAEIDVWNHVLPKIFEEYKEQISPTCASLLKGFLCDPKCRLGGDVKTIKDHNFFKGVDWNNLLAVTPPFIPHLPKEMTVIYKGE